MDRREFLHKATLLSSSALLAAPGRTQTRSSEERIQHLIPTDQPRQYPHQGIVRGVAQRSPLLKIGSKGYEGRRRDTFGRFWSFHASGLESDTQYELSLQTPDGERLMESWPLRTAPALGSRPERLRALVYTCAGGPDDAQWLNGEWRYLPVSTRRRLLRRALEFEPDVAIAVGDQTYWIRPFPQKTGRRLRPELGANLWQVRRVRQRRAGLWSGQRNHLDRVSGRTNSKSLWR